MCREKSPDLGRRVGSSSVGSGAPSSDHSHSARRPGPSRATNHTAGIIEVRGGDALASLVGTCARKYTRSRRTPSLAALTQGSVLGVVVTATAPFYVFDHFDDAGPYWLPSYAPMRQAVDINARHNLYLFGGKRALIKGRQSPHQGVRFAQPCDN